MQATKYVYAVKSPAFPGLIKIGRTQNVRERLSQLNTSCAPCPFVVVVVSPTLDFVRDEKLAHEFFSSQRREGEFFSVSETEVKDFFKTIQEKYDAELSQPPLAESESDRIKDAHFQDLMCLVWGDRYRMLVKDQVHELDEDRTTSRVNHAEPEPVQEQEQVAPILDDLSLKRKRKREELLFDIEMEEYKVRLQKIQLAPEHDRLALEERKLALEERKLQHKTKLIDLVNRVMSSINALAHLDYVDESTEVLAKDYLKNILFDEMATAGPADDDEPHASSQLTVDIVAKELGFHCSDEELQRIEDEMAKQYHAKYKSDPPKHKTSSS